MYAFERLRDVCCHHSGVYLGRLVLAAWARLAYVVLNRLRIQHRTMKGLLALMALQVLAGISVTIATSLDRISAYACLIGA